MLQRLQKRLQIFRALRFQTNHITEKPAWSLKTLRWSSPKHRERLITCNDWLWRGGRRESLLRINRGKLLPRFGKLRVALVDLAFQLHDPCGLGRVSRGPLDEGQLGLELLDLRAALGN